MKYKYIALDFDGTILDKHHKLNSELRDLLINLQDNGIKVFLCSGRNIEGMKDVISQIKTLNYETFIISSNGGEIFKVMDKKMISIKSNRFETKEVLHIKSLIENEANTLVAFEGSNAFLHKFSIKSYFHQVKYGRWPSIGIHGPVNKMLLIDSVSNVNLKYEKVKQLMKITNPEINVFRSVPTLIEITPPGSTKGQALAQIFEDNQYNVEELIAFGDGENDIDMLSFAGLGVCMANGFDTTKAVSDDICRSNIENGVYHYLKGVINA